MSWLAGSETCGAAVLPLLRACLLFRSRVALLFGGDSRWGSDRARLHPALVWSTLVAIDECGLKNKSYPKIWGESEHLVARNLQFCHLRRKRPEPEHCFQNLSAGCLSGSRRRHAITCRRSSEASTRQQEHHTASIGEKESVCICLVVCTRACVCMCVCVSAWAKSDARITNQNWRQNEPLAPP